MNRAQLESNFNKDFASFINQSPNPEIRKYQRELFQFYLLGYDQSNETEEGKFVEGKVHSMKATGAKQVEYSIVADLSVKMDDVLGLVVASGNTVSEENVNG